jgi:hypothetical protein
VTFRLYVEEADDAANKVSHGKRIDIDYMEMNSMCQENKASKELKPFALYAGLSSTPSYRNGRFAISDSGIKSPSVFKPPNRSWALSLTG